jgi:hypothetical protein
MGRIGNLPPNTEPMKTRKEINLEIHLTCLEKGVIVCIDPKKLHVIIILIQ